MKVLGRNFFRLFGGICVSNIFLKSKDKKPIIKIPMTLMEIIAEVVALIGLLLPIIYIAALWSKIPDIVPTHFGISGQANAWGNKGSPARTSWSYYFHLYSSNGIK